MQKKSIFFENYPPENLEIRQFIRIFAENLTHALFGLDSLDFSRPGVVVLSLSPIRNDL
jgi:hypothetical protein